MSSQYLDSPKCTGCNRPESRLGGRAGRYKILQEQVLKEMLARGGRHVRLIDSFQNTVTQVSRENVGLPTFSDANPGSQIVQGYLIGLCVTFRLFRIRGLGYYYCSFLERRNSLK
jgi:hypothetical protein